MQMARVGLGRMDANTARSAPASFAALTGQQNRLSASLRSSSLLVQSGET